MREHIEAITRTSGLPDTAESFERMAAVWMDKKQMFDQQTRALAMREVESLSASDPCGALVLTYSGSLISIDPLLAGTRRIEYASIPLRADVPGLAIAEHAQLEHDLRADAEAVFVDGPVKSTSRVLTISVCGPEVPAAEQQERIRQATIFLTNGFLKINRTIVPPAAGTPEQFTQRSIAAYLAKRSGLTQKQTLSLLKDYHAVVESGMLLGARVPLGRLGRLFLRRRPARKARIGVNPATGEKHTIGAQPESMVARMRFSDSLKDRVRGIEVR